MKRVVMAALMAALVAAPAAAQKKKDRRGLVWNDRPTIVFGKHVNLEIKGRVQLDGRAFEPNRHEDNFDIRTMRIGLKGELTKHFEWEIEREVHGFTTDFGLGQWKDVAADWKTFDAIRVKGGRFKVPFGLEQNTSVSALDFAYRTMATGKLTPGRDRGVMAYGELFHKRMTYEAGVFDDDGDNAEFSLEDQFVEQGRDLTGVGPTVAARVFGEPFRKLPLRRFRNATLGAAYTRTTVPEGLNSLFGEDYFGHDFFQRVYVKGTRQRTGLQFDWTPGPFGFKSEWMQSREQRLGQGNRNQNLSDFIGTGWYASATWIVTGEDKDKDIKPRHELFRGGLGAVELAVRYDQLRFESASRTGAAFRNPRADYQLPNTAQEVTVGANWFANRWVKVVANVMRLTFDDGPRSPVAAGKASWASLLRAQIAF